MNVGNEEVDSFLGVGSRPVEAIPAETVDDEDVPLIVSHEPKSKALPLPSKNVKDIVMAAAPGMKIAAPAQIAFEKVATLSLFYLACLADEDRTQNSKRSTLQVQDIHAALDRAGMQQIEGELETHYKRSRA
ncbi:hypothetical protein ADEAN_000369900 [Angomonas deanei]|uniref:Transcription factor CBF/NF-Y/archaeal histone domain-containing protein n=1 Tax=Angomonas deanei TaxID=59799 RepID=A0A7G2C917_9TRYP|nr:hypothetical protein ADEAN_000369900 [Angomonas deanei]